VYTVYDLASGHESCICIMSVVYSILLLSIPWPGSTPSASKLSPTKVSFRMWLMLGRAELSPAFTSSPHHRAMWIWKFRFRVLVEEVRTKRVWVKRDEIPFTKVSERLALHLSSSRSYCQFLQRYSLWRRRVNTFNPYFANNFTICKFLFAFWHVLNFYHKGFVTCSS